MKEVVTLVTPEKRSAEKIPRMQALGTKSPIPDDAFRPTLVCPFTGRVVRKTDSLEESPELAYALLTGLVLPEDAKRMPDNHNARFHESLAMFARAGQGILTCYEDMTVAAAGLDKQLVEAEGRATRYKGLWKSAEADLKVAKQKCEGEKKAAEELRGEVERLKEQLANERSAAAEREVVVEQAGYDRAILELEPQVEEALTTGEELGMKKGYGAGYRAALTLANHPLESGLWTVPEAPPYDTPEPSEDAQVDETDAATIKDPGQTSEPPSDPASI